MDEIPFPDTGSTNYLREPLISGYFSQERYRLSFNE